MLPGSRHHLSDIRILEQTVEQIMKDFSFVSVTIVFSGNAQTAYAELCSQITPHIEKFIHTNIQQFYNLLYRIDLSEEQVKKAVVDNPEKNFPEIVTDLIIKRELQKVVMRNHYSS